jgi:hypothetical protein
LGANVVGLCSARVFGCFALAVGKTIRLDQKEDGDDRQHTVSSCKKKLSTCFLKIDEKFPVIVVRNSAEDLTAEKQWHTSGSVMRL